MDIRLLDPSHAKDWWQLRLEALETEPDAFGSAPEDHRKLSAEDIAARLRPVEQGNFVYGAFADGALSGMAGFRRDESTKGRHRGNLWGVYVAAPLRGKGVARGLVKAVIARAQSYPGLEHITLTVSVPQDPARKLYESLGFRSWGREPFALKVGDNYVDEYHMVLDLRSRP